MVAAPKVPILQVGFVLTIAGIMFTLYSRSVRQKRVVLPVTIALFSMVWLEGARRTFDPPTFVLSAFAFLLAFNGVRVLQYIRYCSRCGATIQDRKRRMICRSCSSMAAR